MAAAIEESPNLGRRRALARTGDGRLSAFRLIDALLLRPLPVASPERLYFLTVEYKDYGGQTSRGEAFEYPNFRRLRASAKDGAELIAISSAVRMDLTYGSGDDMEKAYRQYVSGWMFDSFGLEPALGRLLTANDDRQPGAHPQAVQSYDYWQSRFGGDPKVVGRSFRSGADTYEIVGVVERGFAGTENGTLTDIFVPTMMNAAAIEDSAWSWFRIWVQLRPGVNPGPVREKLQAALKAFLEEKVKSMAGLKPKRDLEQYAGAPIFLEPASAGVSGLQRDYRRSLLVLAGLAALVLLIACVNVANLFTAQSAARAREMALLVSIGAGRWRLIQLVLAKSLLVAMLASLFGGLLAWWAAPFVAGAINPPFNPTCLIMPMDWRVIAFAVLLTLGATLLFGLAPALPASGVAPVSALKGGADPLARRRLMHALVAAQVAFCFLVHLVAGLFLATFDRLSHRPTGFNADRVLLLVSGAKAGQPPDKWDRVAGQLKAVAGVESVALSDWALMTGSGRNQNIVVDGALREDYQPYFLGVSPGWFDAMRIPMIGGRDFGPGDRHPKVAIVNRKFADVFFGGRNPVGRFFEVLAGSGAQRARVEIVGWTQDATYRSQREGMRAAAYFPFHSDSGRQAGSGTFIVRVRPGPHDPSALAPLLRREVSRAGPEFRVSTIRTQAELVQLHTIRERLLAALAAFFAAVSLLLAALGLFGVLDFSVQQRRREIGIRMALGAQPADVALRVTFGVFAMVLLGAAAGLGAGVASERYLESLLYQVKATDLTMLALPAITIFFAALLAALPPVIRAVRIDPARMLRAD